MGSKLKGPLTSTNGFVGAVTGAVTGNVTGNLTGNVTGNVVTTSITLGGTAISATAAQLNAEAANQAYQIIDGSTGKKAVAVNGTTIITGGTGIADLTLAAPTAGARAIISVGSLSSGNVVITTATGVTFNGTNNTATLNAAYEGLILVYAAANTWAVAANIGGVAFSTV